MRKVENESIMRFLVCLFFNNESQTTINAFKIIGFINQYICLNV